MNQTATKCPQCNIPLEFIDILNHHAEYECPKCKQWRYRQ